MLILTLFKFTTVVLLSIHNFQVTQGVWPRGLLKLPAKSFYECLHVFFFCTDHVGKWPMNEKYCRKMFDICESKLPDPMQGFVNPNPMMSSTFEIPTMATTMSTKKPIFSSPTTSSPAMDLNLSNNIQSDMKNEDSPKTTSCYDLTMNQRYSSSGIYTIYIEGSPKEVYCDMSTNGGGWTVIQRRGDFGNSEDYFQRNWTEYRNGFGHPKKEVWFGLNDLYMMTKSTPVELLITLEDFEADEVQIMVKDFYLGNEESAYEFFYKDDQSVVSSVNDNWYTDQIPSSGTPFLTEAFCANSIYTGGWWFERCIQSNLNGFNLRNEASKEDGLGITWLEWKGPKYSLKTTQMKIRKMNS